MPAPAPRFLALWTALVAVCLVCAASAQAQFRRPQTVFGIREGLPQMQVADLLQDRRGDLWLGTIGGGAARYNGTSFETYTRREGLPSTEVRGLAETPDGHIWMATRNGLVEHDGHRLYDRTRLIGTRFGADPTVTLRTLRTSADGALWVASSLGVYRLAPGSRAVTGPYGAPTTEPCDCFSLHEPLRTGGHFVALANGPAGVVRGTQWTPLQTPAGAPLVGGIEDIAEGPDGSLWLATHTGLVRYRPDGASYRADAPRGPGTGETHILSVQVAPGGAVWLRTATHLHRFDPTHVPAGRFRSFPLPEERHTPSFIAPLLLDSQGTLWTGTPDGLFVLRDDRVIRYEGGIPVDLLFEDHEGNLWVGATNRGLRLLRNAPLLHLPTSVIAGTVWGLASDGARGVWVANDQGIVHYDSSRTARLYTRADGLASAPVYSVARDGYGQLWAASYYGLQRFDGRRFVSAPALPGGVPIDGAMSLKTDPLGRLWALTSAGLVRIDGAHVWRAPVRMSRTAFGDGVMTWGQGALWVYLPGRLLRVDGAQVDSFPLARTSGVTGLQMDVQGRLWMSTLDDGVYVYTVAQGALRRVAHLTTASGLSDNTVWNLGALPDGRLWVAATRGLSFFYSRDLTGGRLPPLTTLHHNDGLVGEPSQGPSLLDAQGRLWLPTSEGVLRYDTRQALHSLVPSARIEAVELFHEALPAALTAQRLPWSGLPAALTLAHRQNTLTFSFASPTFAEAHRLRFRYRLLPVDTAWSPPLALHEATFTALPPRAYTLQVQACLDTQCEPGSEAEYRFTIAPPFWQTWWFYSLMLVGVGSLLQGYIVLRTKRLRQQHLHLEGLVAQRTHELRDTNEALDYARRQAEAAAAARTAFLATMSHEIRTPINGVLGFAGLLHETPLSAEQGEYLATIRSSANALLGLLNDVLDYAKMEAGKLDLNPAPFCFHTLIEEVTTMLAPLAHARGLTLAYVPAPHVDAWRTGDAPRLRQILVNLLGNAIKFTAEGHVVVRLAPDPSGEGRGLLLSVEDTGIGMTAEQTARLFQPYTQASAATAGQYGGTGLGLSIARTLADLMGGTIEVHSRLGEGTRFDVRLALDTPEGPVPERPLAGRRVAVVAACPIERASVEACAQLLGATLADAKPEACVAVRHAGDAPAADAVADPRVPTLVLTPLGPPPSLVGLAQPHTGRLPVTRATLRRLFETPALPPPPAGRPAGPRAAPPAHRPAAGNGLRVLIAEDNVVNQRLIRLLVERMGHTVTLVGNGLQALDAAQQEPFDVALLDVHMPEMDGYATARALAALDTPIAHVAAVTAAVLPEEQDLAYAAGFTAFLHKPIRRDDIKAYLSGLAAARPAPMAPAEPTEA